MSSLPQARSTTTGSRPMSSLFASVLGAFLLLTLQATPTQAQWNGPGGSPPWPNGGGNNNNNNGNNGNTQSGPASIFFSSTEYASWNRALVAHAAIASLVWAFLIPVGGILLRLDLKSPWILRLHVLLQITGFLLYIVAVGLGIYLIRAFDVPYFSLWDDPHPKLGIAILVLAIFQPILGFLHHRIFKRRQAAVKAGETGKPPGRTTPGYMHIWLGRLLIVLGIINGGLGIRLASNTQSAATTRNAALGYGLGAGIMFLLYVVIVAMFEAQKPRTKTATGTARGNVIMMTNRGGGGDGDGDTPPAYAESQENPWRNGRAHPPSYQPAEQSTRYSYR